MTGSLTSTGFNVRKGASNTIALGSLYLWGNGLSGSSERDVVAQLNALNGLDYWIYNGSAWVNTGAKINASGTMSAQPGVSGLDLVNVNQLNTVSRPTLNFYANDSAADADSNLLSGSFYKITGSRQIYQKP